MQTCPSAVGLEASEALVGWRPENSLPTGNGGGLEARGCDAGLCRTARSRGLSNEWDTGVGDSAALPSREQTVTTINLEVKSSGHGGERLFLSGQLRKQYRPSG